MKNRASSTCMESILVDRYREVFEIYHVYASSVERVTTPKPTIPVLPHYPGMGKTSVALLFPQVIQRPPEVNDEERRRILREVSQSRFWSPRYEALVERAIADKTTNVLVALLTARWEDNPRIKSVSCFATCKPLLIVAPSGAFDDSIIMQRIVDHFEPAGSAADTSNPTRVLRKVAQKRPLCVVLDEMQNQPSNKFKDTILDLLDMGAMVIFCGVTAKATLDKNGGQDYIGI
jgi:hypothetical protein